MFTLTIRDYLKCAHSLKGEIFGPAQLMHVITYEVEAVFITDELDEYGLIVDFASTQNALQEILRIMNFKNLDEVPQLNGKNTTTEFLCQYIHEHICNAVADQFKGSLRVVLRESAVAEVSYEKPVPRKKLAPPGRCPPAPPAPRGARAQRSATSTAAPGSVDASVIAPYSTELARPSAAGRPASAHSATTDASRRPHPPTEIGMLIEKSAGGTSATT